MAKELEDKLEEELEEGLEEKPEDKAKDKLEDKVDEIEEDFISPGVSGPTPGVLDKIANIFKRDKSESEETEEVADDVKDEEPEKDEEETEADKKEYEEIDPKFIEAASSYGWDNQRIIDYADGHTDEDMVLMAGLMQDSIPKIKPELDAEDIKDESKDEDTEALLKLAEDDPKIAAFLDRVIKPLAKRLDDVSSVSDEVKKDLDSRKEAEQLKEDKRNIDTANDILDKSGVSSLGKAKDLPTYPDGSYAINDPAFQERAKIWDVAQMFYAKGGTFQQAMKSGLRWYKGENLEKDVKDKVVRDLKKQEERVMPKRQEVSGVKTYTNEEERKADVINAALSKYNVELPTT